MRRATEIPKFAIIFMKFLLRCGSGHSLLRYYLYKKKVEPLSMSGFHLTTF